MEVEVLNMSFLHLSSIPQSLYLHYPLCRHVCSYCDFNVFSKKERGAYDSRWTAALEKHLAAQLEGAGSRPLRTIYLGGGTPSLLEAEHLGELNQVLNSFFNFSSCEEFTIESNPESLTSEKISLWKQMGVTRVSLGVQSFQSHVLKRLERLGTRSSIESSLGELAQSGLAFSLDLMIGVPDQSFDDFSDDLERALRFDPHHISIYILTLDKKHKWFKSEFMRQRWVKEDDLVKMYSQLCRVLKASGYEHYEVSNFSKPGFASSHNSNYWDPQSGYLGLGPGAHGYTVSAQESRRYQNTKDLMAWEDSATGVENVEVLTQEQRDLEALYLLFRTRQWCTLSFDPKLVESLVQEGVLESSSEGVRLTEGSWILIDAVIGRLLRSI